MNDYISQEKERVRLRIKHSLLFPVFFILLIWLMFFLKEYGGIKMYQWGIYPLQTRGLKGILLSPLVHASYSHLISNTVPLFVLMWSIFYFYRDLAYKIFIFSYIFSGIWVWFGARDAWHIGASGLVYAFAAFVFLSGILRKRKELMALALVVVFLYGDLIWGMFPMKKDTDISFEGHLLGALAGVILAIFYKKKGPQKIEIKWEDDEIEELETEYEKKNINDN